MRKTGLLILGLIPILLFGQNKPDWSGSVRAASEALKTGNISTLVQAEKKLREVILAGPEADSGITSEQKKQAEILLYWCSVFIRESGDVLPEPVSPEPPSETPPEKEPEAEPAVTNDPDPAGTETAAMDKEELKEALLNAVQNCKRGKFEEGEAFLRDFVNNHKDGTLESLRTFLTGFLTKKKDVIASVMDQLSRMEGETIIYRPFKGGQFFSGKVARVKDEIVYIKREHSSMGVSFRTLAPGSLSQVSDALTHIGKVYLVFHLMLCGYEETEASLFQYALHSEDSSGKAFREMHNLLQEAQDTEHVDGYLSILMSAKRSLEEGNYASAFKAVLRIDSANDSVLKMVSEAYAAKTGESISTLLYRAMTDCPVCKGRFSYDCPKCKGRGKILEDSPDDALFGQGSRLQIVKCPTCNGKGKLYCRACYRRRTSEEGLELRKRLIAVGGESERPAAVDILIEKHDDEPEHGNNKDAIRLEGDLE